jgi:hypothetical protein
MKKTVLSYGLIAGLIVSCAMITTMATGIAHLDSNRGMILGYTSMIVSFSFIFVAVKSYRDKYNDGTITFGKAFKIGLLISLIASTMYVVSWLIDYYYFIPDFMEKYAAQAIEKLKASGASAAEVEATTREMAQFREWYKNPFFNALITYTEILPVGLLASLVAALTLKRKQRGDMATA